MSQVEEMFYKRFSGIEKRVVKNSRSSKIFVVCSKDGHSNRGRATNAGVCLSVGCPVDARDDRRGCGCQLYENYNLEV